MKNILKKSITCIFLGACLAFASDEQNSSPLINGKSVDSLKEEKRITNDKEWDLRTRNFLQEDGLIIELLKNNTDEPKSEFSELGLLGIKNKKLYERLSQASIREQELEKELYSYRGFLTAKTRLDSKITEQDNDDLFSISKSKREANYFGFGERP